MFNTPATGPPGEPQVKLDQFFEKMLPAFIKIAKPSVPTFSGDQPEYFILFIYLFIIFPQ